MSRDWSDFLRRGPACGHAVQIYRETDELARPVAAYFAAGFAAGEPAVLVATPENRRAFAGALERLGWEAGALDEHGLLATADAEGTLASFLAGDGPSPERFERVVGGLLDEVSERRPGRTIRVFGEMVDLLSGRGANDAALALERLWNELAGKRRFSLLCAYRLDVFDRDAQAAALPGVCQTHSHVSLAGDATRLERAVERALEEVLGREEAERVYLLLGEEDEAHVPAAQRVLMWISAQRPAVADRVLVAARAKYEWPALALGR